MLKNNNIILYYTLYCLKHIKKLLNWNINFKNGIFLKIGFSFCYKEKELQRNFQKILKEDHKECFSQINLKELYLEKFYRTQETDLCIRAGKERGER